MPKKQDSKAELEAAKKRVPADAYSEYLQKIELRDVILTGITCKRLDVPLDGPLSYALDESAAVLAVDAKTAQMSIEYVIKAKCGAKRIGEVKAKYVTVFRLSEQIPREFFVLYNAYSLPLQTYPYMRECVHSLFPKMGLPPLVLPLRKFLIGK